MGAVVFTNVERGKTAKNAFDKAVNKACYDYGHSGYTGTIAEKDCFVMIGVPEEVDPFEFVDQLIQKDDSRIVDKWGPAGCIKITDIPQRNMQTGEAEDEFLFFGWASC